jgi:hypothetical protein
MRTREAPQTAVRGLVRYRLTLLRKCLENPWTQDDSKKETGTKAYDEPGRIVISSLLGSVYRQGILAARCPYFSIFGVQESPTSITCNIRMRPGASPERTVCVI